MRIAVASILLLIQTFQCLALDDSPFILVGKHHELCVLPRSSDCYKVRWTTGNRLLALNLRKCLGAQGRTVGSLISLYDCDEQSRLQRWECKNETLLALQGTPMYMSLKADKSLVLTKELGPDNEFVIRGSSTGACLRTNRELYTIGGNGFGRLCMFPFQYKDVWFDDCTTLDSSSQRRWCGIQTRYDSELWGYCPTTSTRYWKQNIVTGQYFQINTQSALTWHQAYASCRQQGAMLLSVSDPSEQMYITALLEVGNYRLWIGLNWESEHGWQWSGGKPFRYLRWDSGYPLMNPGYNCAYLEPGVRYYWQNAACTRKYGYVCYKPGGIAPPLQVEQGFCSSHWIAYNGHCFYLNRSKKSWSEAQIECGKQMGNLASINHIEDKSFVISQLGYASTDELWIGLNDRKTEGLFEWIDHSTVTFTSWENTEPSTSGGQEDCVLIRGENGNWADRYCEEKHGFICAKLSATEPSGDEEETDLGCKLGWKRHGSYCYLVGSETKTFDEAKDDCKSSSAYLADVSNGVDNAFLVSLLGMRPERYFWLGLSNQNNVDNFVWTNTNNVKFTHWNADNPGHRQGCVAIATGVSAGLWDVLPCANKEKYVCKHLAEGAPLTAVPATVAPVKCADGWKPVGLRNVCAKFFTGPRSGEKTWYEARDYCQAIGGDLLSLHSALELSMDRRHARAWIGLSEPSPGSGYVWSDGSPVNFLHWMDGEPNNQNNVESCAEFKMYYWDEGGSWNDMQCDTYNDWLCQIRAGVTPKTPPNNTVTDVNVTSDGWLEWRGNQYFINSNFMAMEDARNFCQRRHGDLVTINSAAENTFLWKQVSRSYGNYYIGLTVDFDNSFGWMDGSEVAFQRWDENQPEFRNNDENCVVLTNHNGFWHDFNCGHEHRSICKRTVSSPVNTTLAPPEDIKGGCAADWARFKTKVRVFLMTHMAEASTTDVWTGLNSLGGGEFFWTDGRAKRYRNWGFSKHRRNGYFYPRFDNNLHLRRFSPDTPASSYRPINMQENCVVISSDFTLGFGKWFGRSCNDTNGYVCQRNVDLQFPVSRETLTPSTYVPLGNDSVKIVTQSMTWGDAKKRCAADGAQLATVRKEWTKAYVELQTLVLNSSLWIGLNKQETGGYFRFISGWHLSLVNWGPGEPGSEKPCVYVDVDGAWKTEFCNKTMYSACTQSTEVAPTASADYPGTCPGGARTELGNAWMPFKANCYMFVTEEIEWPHAASECARLGGVLTSIEDPDEQKFIQEQIKIFEDSQRSFWIGLYKTHSGKWLWLDNTVMDYTNWEDYEPDENSYAAVKTSEGKWVAGHRRNDRAYICKTPKVALFEVMPTPARRASDAQVRAHTSLVVVLVIAMLSSLAAIALFLYKKSGRSLPTFENPLYYDGERSQPDLVDTNKLLENAEEEHPEPIITL